MQKRTRSTNIGKQELAIKRIFDVPRVLLWKAWTEPERMKQWWGPKAYTAPFIKIDLRVDGEYLSCMRSHEGKDYWSKGVYREIVQPERLVMTDSFADEKGNTVPASYYGLSSDFPLELQVTVTFEAHQGKTMLTMLHAGFPSIAERDSAQAGWNESLDKLADYLTRSTTRVIAEPGKQEVFITRQFEAPREIVFKAFTDPKLYVQWLGPRNLKMNLETFEPRSSGHWRYIHEDSAGNKFAFHGVYHEVLEPSLMIDTFEFEGLPEKGHVSLETARFEEMPGGRTRLNIQSVFQSVADRDGVLQSGMEEGLSDSFNRLDELLAKMKREGINKVAKLNPYLKFNGNCREAMEFYRKCLGGELKILTAGESPVASQMPPEMKSKVMHSMLEKDSIVIMAADMMEQGEVIKGNNISLSIIGTSKGELETYFSKLSEGGSLIHPLEQVFFGVYGDFTDKFGINWMFQADNPKS